MSKITYSHYVEDVLTDAGIVTLSDNGSSFGVIVESSYRDFLEAKMSVQNSQSLLDTLTLISTEKLAIKSGLLTDHTYTVDQVERHEILLIIEQNYADLLASSEAILISQQAILDGMVEEDDPVLYAAQQAIVIEAQQAVTDLLESREAEELIRIGVRDDAQSQYDSDLIALNLVIAENLIAIQELADAGTSLSLAVLEVESRQNIYNNSVIQLAEESAILLSINPVVDPTGYAAQQIIVNTAQALVDSTQGELDTAEAALIVAQDAEISAESGQSATQASLIIIQGITKLSLQSLNRSIADLLINQEGVLKAEEYLLNYQSASAEALANLQGIIFECNQAATDANLATIKLIQDQKVLDEIVLLSVVVPDSQIMERISEGIYEYEFEDPSLGLTYIYNVEIGGAFQTFTMESTSLLNMSYVTLEYFEGYLDGCMYTEYCQDIENAIKVKAALSSTRIINRLNYVGEKSSDEQDFEFPRIGQLTIPEDIKSACCEIMLSLLDGVDANYEFEKLGVASQKYADIKTTYKKTQYDAHILAGVPSILAWKLLLPYIDYSSELNIDLCRVN